MQTHSMRPLSEAQIDKESKVKETDLNELAAQNRIENYIFLERIFIECAHISHVCEKQMGYNHVSRRQNLTQGGLYC